MSPISLAPFSQAGPHFSGYHQANNPELKNLKPGDKLGIIIIESDASTCEQKSRAEKVVLEKIEGHQGRAYDPDTFTLAEPSSATQASGMNNDFSFPTHRIFSPVPPAETGKPPSNPENLDQIDLVTVKKEDGQVLQFLYGDYRLGSRGPYAIHNVERKDHPHAQPKHLQIALFIDHGKTVSPVKDYSVKRTFNDILLKIGGPFYALANMMRRRGS
jgi:hypothetical protein